MIRKSMWLLSAGLCILSAPAMAQSTDQSSTDTDKGSAEPTQGATAEAAAVQDQAREQQPIDTGDIVITATRRNEALSDVPLAVSAVTADTLQNSGASDIRQLQQVSPSLFVSSTTSEGAAAVARIRGIGTVGDNPGLEGSVAVYIDGVYRSRTSVGLTELGPLDRIEVLRGPQGTLFGRNASAGVISVITAKPQFHTFVSGAASIGNYDMRRLEASVNAPLGSTVAARLDGVWMKRDGFVKEVLSGRDLNDRDRWLLRGQLLFQPSDNLSVRLIGDYSRRDEECCVGVRLPAHNYVAGVGETPSSVAALLTSLGAVLNDDPWDREVALTPGRSFRSDVKDWGLSGEVVYDFGGAELTSLTAYRTNKYVGGQDADFTNVDIIVRPDDGGFANTFKTFTQEVRLQGSALGDRLDWLVGGFYADEKLTRRDDISYGADADLYFRGVVRGLNPAFAAFPGFNFLNPFAQGFVLNQLMTNPQLSSVPPLAYPLIVNAVAGQVVSTPLANTGTRDVWHQDGKNYALFTHNIFKITDQLSLTLGARYTVDKKKVAANLTSTSTCAAYLGNIARLQQLAAAAAADPTGNGGLNPVIAALASGFATAVLTPIRSAPCGILNSINGEFGGASNTERKWSGTAVLSYKPTPNLLTYASYSRGYKGGGYNLDRSGLTFGAVDLQKLRFKPELVDAYELGAKWNGRGFDVNVALFDEEFKNFQLNTFNGVIFVVENINSCSESLGGADRDSSAAQVACGGKIRPGVRSRGVEIETFFRPMRDVSGSLGATIANTRYRDNLVGADGNALTPTLFQLPGRRVSNAPRFTMTGSLGWTPPIGGSGMRALFYVDGRHQSQFNSGSDLDLEKVEDGYTIINARVGVRGRDDRWSVELWAQNLFNEKYKQVAFDAPLQGSCTRRGADLGFCSPVANVATQLYGAFLGDPRTIGATLRFKWAPEERMAAPPPPPLLPPPPAMETCADGSMVAAGSACPVPPPPPPPPPPPTTNGERG
jgi:outer membrane receptor protein involved in Fe transport